MNIIPFKTTASAFTLHVIVGLELSQSQLSSKVFTTSNI